MLDLQSHTCGLSWKLKKSRFNTDLRHFFSKRIISSWNEVDKDTVTAYPVHSFKEKLQKLKDNAEEFPFGHWLSDELQWPSQLPWRGQYGKLL